MELCDNNRVLVWEAQLNLTCTVENTLPKLGWSYFSLNIPAPLETPNLFLKRWGEIIEMNPFF